MNSLYEDIKNINLKAGSVYVNPDGHHILIKSINMCKDTYKPYPVLNSILSKILKPKIVSKAINWTFTVQLQSNITIINDEEIRGIFTSSIVSVDYEESTYKKFKEYEKYLLKDVEFPSTPLTKVVKKKKK